MASLKLTKQERLKSRKLINQLFDSGQSIFSHPIKLIFLELPELDTPVKIAVSVPKRTFKLAVERNAIKRRIREAYRLNKPGLINKIFKANRHIIIMFIFVGKVHEDYSVIDSAMKKLLARL